MMHVRKVALILMLTRLVEHYGSMITDAGIRPRNIFGKNPNGDEFKYVASVFFKGLDAYYEWNDKEEYSQSSSLAKHLRDGYLGVGAVLSARYVLTSASCLKGPKPANMWGDSNQYRRVKQVLQHSDYSEKTGLNDLALLELNEPFSFSSKTKIDKVCIDNVHAYLVPGSELYLASYGFKFAVTGSKSVMLKHDLHRDFRNELLSYNIMRPVNYYSQCQQLNSICARGKDDYQSACFGDEGAPLLSGNSSQQYLIGILSFTIDAENATHFTCRAGLISKFTLVEPYINWIFQYVKRDLCVKEGRITPPTTQRPITTNQKTTTTTTTQKTTTTTQRTTTKKPTTESISTTVEYVTTTTTESPSTTEEDDDEPDRTIPSRKPIDPGDSSHSHTDARTVTSPKERRTKSINRNLLLIIAVIILLIFALVIILIIVKNRY